MRREGRLNDAPLARHAARDLVRHGVLGRRRVEGEANLAPHNQLRPQGEDEVVFADRELDHTQLLLVSKCHNGQDHTCKEGQKGCSSKD